jgi:hypothetical protein
MAIELLAGPTEMSGSSASVAPADNAKKFRTEQQLKTAFAVRLRTLCLPSAATNRWYARRVGGVEARNLQKNLALCA